LQRVRKWKGHSPGGELILCPFRNVRIHNAIGRRLRPSGCEGSVPASYLILLLSQKMALLPSSWLLRRLRRVILDDADALTGTFDIRDVLPALRSLRANFQRATHSDSQTEGIDAFLKTWQAFSILPSFHPLYLHPLFENDELLMLLKNEATIAILLEQVQAGRGPGVPGTGHRVLGGAVGVGKTYILRGLSLVLATLCTYSHADNARLSRSWVLPAHQNQMPEPP